MDLISMVDLKDKVNKTSIAGLLSKGNNTT